jgi:hypothetical protein
MFKNYNPGLKTMKPYLLLFCLFITACVDSPYDTSQPYYGNYVGDGMSNFNYNGPEFDDYNQYGSGYMNENPYFGSGQYMGGYY